MKRTCFACLFQTLTTCGVLTLALLFAPLLIVARPAQAQTETVLYSFTDSPDGAIPTSHIISDGAGNFYGTTWNGGVEGWGTVFEFSPNGSGGWNETVLHSFTNEDGAGPFGGLIFDTAGNLYGTTGGGGTNGGGTVFELTPNNGTWTETVLYNFCSAPNCKDGGEPWDTLIFDTAGNLYGTTRGGGAYGNYGTVFELTPNNGTWTEKVLHSFGKGKDGWNPFNSLVFDAAGNLYGVAEFGGAHGYGIAFELMPKNKGKWVERVLHSFNDNGKDGIYPEANLIFDAAGNLYGTTFEGGLYGSNGTAFELTRNANGNWKEKVLYSFGFASGDGSGPFDSFVFDAAGNLYGTTTYGGAYGYWGTVFELTPGLKGKWTETVLHSFNHDGTDGYWPDGGVIVDEDGHLYGTTAYGGSDGTGCGGDGCGTVFEITP